MAKRVPVMAAKRVAQEQGLRQVVLLAYDGELVHVVTYGKTKADCADAAKSGAWIMRALKSPVPIDPAFMEWPQYKDTPNDR